jgi:hypothetical protein
MRSLFTYVILLAAAILLYVAFTGRGVDLWNALWSPTS